MSGSGRLVRLLLLAGLVVGTGVAGSSITAPPARAETDRPHSILVVAPHPDDDILLGAGVAAAGVASGDLVKVVFMTNGDVNGQSSGLQRQDLAVEAQTAHIGTNENDLIFLGYPDAYMQTLLVQFAAASDVLTTARGRSTTYGARGLGGTDYHDYRFGTHATYNGANVIQDLEAILETYRPDDIYVTSAFDAHGDHAATYGFVRTALMRRLRADSTYRSTIHECIVWANDASLWPAPIDPSADNIPIPGLAGTKLVWAERESIRVPLPMQSTNLSTNPKYLAVRVHDSGLENWVHRDEVFWLDKLPPAGESDVATKAAATASSQDSAFGQTAAKAIDGVIAGFPGDGTKEWSTLGGKAGSWLKLTWAEPVTIDSVVLYDRPNYDDHVTAGTLRFSDGTSVPTGRLANNGSATTLSFAPRSVTSVRFEVDQVSSNTYNIGLAEIEVFGTTGPVVNRAPTAEAGAAQTVASAASVQLDGSGSHDPDGDALTYRWTQTAGPTVALSNPAAAKPAFAAPQGPASLTFQLVVSDAEYASPADAVQVTVSAPVPNRAPTAEAGPAQTVASTATVQLDGTASSDPDGDALTYRWTQTGGPIVLLSNPTAAKPSFTAPQGPVSLTFQLTVSDAEYTSAADAVAITVLVPGPPPSTNVAAVAVVTASSQESGLGQTAAKAIDGVPSGYPADYTKEWATSGGKAGSWLKLTWASPVTIESVVLYDRPNLSDQITAGTLRFSDGTSVPTGSLANNGSATTITFSRRTVTSVQLDITAVGSNTYNIGLAEIEVWGWEN